MIPNLPGAAGVFVAFGTLLRSNGFAVSVDQTVAFLQATELLGPVSIESVRRAAHATFGPAQERREEFDALFRAHFHGDVVALQEATGEKEGVTRHGKPLTVSDRDSLESGRAASHNEALLTRRFDQGASETLRRLARELPKRLPRRRAFRRAPQKRGVAVDLRRSLASVVRNDGDLPRPLYSVRQTRPRNLVLLIDVSGSMKQYTDEYLQFAYNVARSTEAVEVFTLGTRLTRISRELKAPNQKAALAKVSVLVKDWNGGTRLGAAFGALLSSPRFVNFVRGAAVIVLSDALETGGSKELQQSVRRLRRLAWRLSWATPLAADPSFRPETAALRSILPDLDDLVNGGDLASLVNFTLGLASRRSPVVSLSRQL